MWLELELEQHLPLTVANPRYCTTMRVKMAQFKIQARKVVQENMLKASQEQGREIVLQGDFACLLEE